MRRTKSLGKYLQGQLSNNRFAWRQRLWKIIKALEDEAPVLGFVFEKGSLKILLSELKYMRSLDRDELQRHVNFKGVALQEIKTYVLKQYDRVKRAQARTPDSMELRQQHIETREKRYQAVRNKAPAANKRFRTGNVPQR